MENTEKKEYFRKNLKIILIVVLMIVTCFCIYVAFAKYAKSLSGTGSATIAGIVCDTNVTAYNSTENETNPYCNVVIKNYDENNTVTDVSYNYTLTVSTTDEGMNVPDYYWTDSSNNVIANTLDGTNNVVGDLGKDTQETDSYKLTFINPGDSDFIQNITVSTDAVQKNNN